MNGEKIIASRFGSAARGKRIPTTPSQELARRYGKGIIESVLNRVVKFANEARP